MGYFRLLSLRGKLQCLLLLCFITILFISNVFIMENIFGFAKVGKGLAMWQRRSILLDVLGTKDTKTILLWSEPSHIPKKGKVIYSKANCPLKNCVVFHRTKEYPINYSSFDAIIFSEGDIDLKDKPDFRTKSQIYIFSTLESSYNFPACEVVTDNFFNWTFTYRLDSTIPWPYFVVTNTSGAIVAPSTDVRWQQSSAGIVPGLKDIWAEKKQVAAWLVNHCDAGSPRDDNILAVQEALISFSVKIDIHGKCTHKECKYNNCSIMIKKDYFFYMAYENAFAEDFVTEKVLYGYNNFAVPVVFGGANYTRFLPPGSYLNAREYSPYNLAIIMIDAMKNFTSYEQFFKWKKYYRIQARIKNYYPLCDLCGALNTEYAKNAPAIKYFRRWWNGLKGMRWCLPQEHLGISASRSTISSEYKKELGVSTL